VIVNAGGGDIGVTEPLLDLGDVGLMVIPRDVGLMLERFRSSRRRSAWGPI
jgi:hypothetical protein